MPSISFPFTIKMVMSTRDMYNKKDESGVFSLGRALSHGSSSVVVGGSDGMPSEQIVSSVLTTKVPGVEEEKGFETCRFSVDVTSGVSVLRLLIDSEHHISDQGIQAQWTHTYNIPLDFCLGSSLEDYTAGRPFFAHIKPSALDDFFKESQAPLLSSMGPLQQSVLNQFKGAGYVSMSPVEMKISFLKCGSVMDTVFVVGNVGDNKSIEVHYSPMNVEMSTALVVTVPEDVAGQEQVLAQLKELSDNAPKSVMDPSVFTATSSMKLDNPVADVCSPTKRKASETAAAPSPKKSCVEIVPQEVVPQEVVPENTSE